MDNRKLTLRALCAAAVWVFLMVSAVPAVADYESGNTELQAGWVAETVAQWRAATDGSERQAMPVKGSRFKDCEVCPEMVVIPAGEYVMGSPAGEEQTGGANGPQHRVRIGRPIAVGKYGVTFEEWDACVSGGGCGGYRPGDGGWGRGRRPVVNVNWDDAKAYVAWLSEKTGKRYRLLSEAEWEYAARAGTSTTYHWGDEIGRNRANCDGCGSRWDDEKTSPVGSFEPNEYGLHDMHGNVFEWVEDCWHENYMGAPTDGSAWTTGGSWSCDRRVMRGGSWYSKPELLRSAHRLWDTARKAPIFGDGRAIYHGFRVARTLAR